MGTNCPNIYESIWAAAQYAGQQASNLAQAAGQQAQPIPEPAPELCAYKDCGERPTDAVHHCNGSCWAPCPRNTLGCHDFVPTQAVPQPAAKDIPSPETARPFGEDTEAARGWEAAATPTRLTAAVRALDRKIDTNETGPSAVAAAPGIEPWRPSVDDWDLLADAETGWRR